MLSIDDILAALRWWLALTGMGLLAFPLSYVLLGRLPDRGYAFARMTGLLLVSYLFWLMGSLGFAGNQYGAILLALLIVGALSIWFYRVRHGDAPPLREWLRANKGTILASELIFAGVFALWVWVRAQNPAITATEKPMEFAFLNAVGRSPIFPPLDPWLSGYAISYYYFGYVMTSLLAQLAFVAEPVAFNLAIAWLIAGAAVGAYGIVYNLIAVAQRGRAAVTMGLIAALAVAVAGNLQIGLELLHGNNISPAAFWQWLDVRDVNSPPVAGDTPRYETSSWWWWRTSRVIHEYHLSGRPEEGLEPIVEIPAFSFVLGDLHPHVLALPFAFLGLAVGLTWWLQITQRGSVLSERWRSAGLAGRARALIEQIGGPLWLFTAVVLGGLSFLNTWDVLIYLFIVLGAFYLAAWYRGQGHAPAQTAYLAVMLIAPAVLLYLPFYIGFRSQAGPPFLLPMLMRPTRLAHYLIIFGLPLIPISVLLFALAWRQRFRYLKRGLIVVGLLLAGLIALMLLLAWVVAAGPEGASRFGGLAAELGLALPDRPEQSLAPLWGAQALFAVLPSLLAARLFYPALTLFLAALLTLIVMIWNEGAADEEVKPDVKKAAPSSALPFALLLIAAGLLLTLGPEFVYLRDNFGFRLNTTFKFYYQAWIFFGVAAVFALDYLWRMAQSATQRIVPTAVTASYVALLAVALLFPYFAVRSRSVEYRGPATTADGGPAERQPATLDGLAYLRRFNPGEYEAIMWLRENTPQTGMPPVVLEAVGGQYSNFARVSANTGLPTVVGWPGHEWQWRGGDHPEPGQREQIVRQIYTAPELPLVGFLLDRYGVQYIFVGDREVEAYGAPGMEKFREQLDVAFANDRVTIYRWQPPDNT